MMSYNVSRGAQGQAKTPAIPLGFDLDLLQRGIKSKLLLPLSESENSHLLLIGESGSGKSYALHRIISLLGESGCDLIFANFKGDDTFRYLRGLPRYFEYKSTLDAISYVYELLNERLAGTSAEPQVTLCIDEFVSLMLSLQSDDTKLAKQVSSKISECALMGRSLGIRLILSTQRPDISSGGFTSGSRDQIGNCIALSTLSPQARRMVFPTLPDDLKERQFERGEGRAQLNGKFYHIKIPTVSNFDNVKNLCIAALSKPL